MCKLTLKTTNIAVVDNQLQLTIPTTTFSNHQEFNLILCQNIPATAGVDQVILVNGSTKINMNVMTGNYLRADQIKARRCYPFVYGNDPVHVSLQCLVKCSCYDVINVSSPSSKKEE